MWIIYDLVNYITVLYILCGFVPKNFFLACIVVKLNSLVGLTKLSIIRITNKSFFDSFKIAIFSAGWELVQNDSFTTTLIKIK